MLCVFVKPDPYKEVSELMVFGSVINVFYSQAILSPSLWQVNSMALSTMARVTLSPGLSSSGRQRADTERKSTRHSLAAGTWSLGGKYNIILGSIEAI